MVALGSPPGGALHRSIDPEGALWTPATYLLAAVVDYEAVSVWQRGSGKTAKPKPVPRPNVKQKPKGRSLTKAALESKTGAPDGR